MTAKFSDNPYYLEYEALLKQLHELMAAGKSDSNEAETIRDKMDSPWLNLSREEIQRLNGLSADLYMLQDDEVFEKYDGTQEQLRSDLGTAWERRDWARVLALLRKGPAHISPQGLASLRAQAYKALGHDDTARMFEDYAAQLILGQQRFLVSR